MGQKGRGAPKKGNRGTRDTFTPTSSSKSNSSQKDKKPNDKKPQPKLSETTTTTTTTSSPVPPKDPKHQQQLLDIFSQAFTSVLSSENFATLLQEIKQALFSRDFSRAFGREDYLDAYAARWSPTRALCYASVFQAISEHLNELVVFDKRAEKQPNADPGSSSSTHDGGDESPALESEVEKLDLSKERQGSLRMLSLGGCAAEHVAFASHLSTSHLTGSLTLLDSAPWTNVTIRTQAQLRTLPTLPKYAGAAAKAANRPLLEEDSQLSLKFCQDDILALSKERLLDMVDGDPLVVTVMFTLNELYTNGGIGKTTKFLANLGQCLPDGSLFLVLDSPGSYSEATLGKEKKYPMQWLLNHTLLETDVKGVKWERLESHESIWFRLGKELSYPHQLEDMRYQLHLYRVTKILD